MPRIAKKARPVPAVEVEIPEAFEPPAVQTDPQPAEAQPNKPMRTLSFFEGQKRIQSEDWGTRANVYLYRLEPITDRLKGGNSTVFVMKYDEPVDQDKILVDFPPKVPPGEWVNDSRNKKWAWAAPMLPKTAAQQQQEQAQRPIDDTVEKFRLFRDMANDFKQEAKAQQPVAAPLTPAADPIMTGLAIAEKFMSMKADNPMVEVMKTMLEHQRLELTVERERSERLAAELRKESQPAKSGLGNLTELVAEAQKLGLIPEGGLKGLWGGAKDALQAVTRSRMSGSEEFWQPIVTGLLDSIKPVLPMVVARIAQAAPRPQQQQQQPGAAALPQGQQPAPNGAAPPPSNGAPPAATEAPPVDPQLAQAFFSEFGPALIQWFKEGKGDGGDFASWIFDGYGADWKGLKWMHLKQAAGAENIVSLFQTSPFWPEIAAAGDKFAEFIKSFVEWQPEAAQAVVDLEEQEEVEEVQP
jgi:hypothetical protein